MNFEVNTAFNKGEELNEAGFKHLKEERNTNEKS